MLCKQTAIIGIMAQKDKNTNEVDEYCIDFNRINPVYIDSDGSDYSGRYIDPEDGIELSGDESGDESGEEL